MAAVNLGYRAPAPHPPIYLPQCDRGPPTIDGLGSPDQRADQVPFGPLGPKTGGDQSNILPLDLILITYLKS